MKFKLPQLASLLALAIVPAALSAQAPTLGTTAGYVLFTTNGALTNTGQSHLTGNVGSNSGSSTGFGNVNGVMNNNNGATGTAAADLLTAYGQLNSAVATQFPAPLLGNGQTLNAGIYSISGNSTLSNTLTLNGQNNPNAVFIIKIQGTFSSGAGSKVVLTNGALACNVFWKVEGAVSLASGTTMKGTIIANNAAISISSGVNLEGRAMTTAGAITINNVKAYTPVGCGSPTLNGPAAPTLSSTACYVLFTSNGPATNTGITYLTGDVGTNVGLTTGYNSLYVTGAIHPIPDGSTANAAAHLTGVYNQLNALAYDIELLYPAQFGNSLVLTPHVYRLNGATTLTDTLFLNAMGNANAVFVIQINGALSTSTFAKIALINGTQARNVFWKVEGAININNYSEIEGTMIANNGAIALNTGVELNGRALSTTGALQTDAVIANMTQGCSTAPAPSITSQPVNKAACMNGSVTFSVVSSGVGLSYQWRKGNVNLVNGGNISGANSSKLTINPVTGADVATNYNVIVTGATSPQDTSNFVSLSIGTAPVINNAPSNQVVCPTGTATFSVAASGGGLSYQWRRGTTNLVNGGSISGVFTATLVINPMMAADTAGNYNVVVTGACNPKVTSPNAMLSMCNNVGLSSVSQDIQTMNVYPNPFSNSLNLTVNDLSKINHTEIRVYNLIGVELIVVPVTRKTTTLQMDKYPAGVYFYKLTGNNGTIQSGRLVSEK